MGGGIWSKSDRAHADRLRIAERQKVRTRSRPVAGAPDAEGSAMIEITPRIAISEDEIELAFVRASGPGGQNVNKVSSAVQLRFDAAGSPNLPEGVKIRLVRLAGKRMTQSGVIIIQAQRFRTQERNREDALARLVDLIRSATVVAPIRRPTRPTLGSKERRLAAKERRGEVKSLRRDKPQAD